MDKAAAGEGYLTVVPLTLVDEISHRVLNEYTHAIGTLSLAAADATSSEARATLSNVAERLLAYADVHRALRPPRLTEQIDLGQYLQRLCAALTAARLADRGVRLTFIESTARLQAQQCWRVGLIVSELVTNAVRHAFPERGGALLVELSSSPGLLYCRVSDNGGASIPHPQPGRGRSIVDALARQLGGNVHWVFGAGGATVTLSFPAEGDA
jgi:two-component sensor histidine kinase